MEVPYACSTDDQFTNVYVETYDYGGNEPVSVTITQEYDAYSGRSLASPVTIPTRYEAGTGRSGVYYKQSNGSSSYCNNSRYASDLHKGYYRLGYTAMNKTSGGSFCKAYRINF